MKLQYMKTTTPSTQTASKIKRKNSGKESGAAVSGNNIVKTTTPAGNDGPFETEMSTNTPMIGEECLSHADKTRDLWAWRNTLPVTGTWGTLVPKQARTAIDAIIASSDDPIRTTVFASGYADLMDAKTSLYVGLRDKNIEEWCHDSALDDMIKQRECANIIARMYSGDNALLASDEGTEELRTMTDVLEQGGEIAGHYEVIALVYTELAAHHADLIVVMKVIDAAFDTVFEKTPAKSLLHSGEDALADNNLV